MQTWNELIDNVLFSNLICVDWDERVNLVLWLTKNMENFESVDHAKHTILGLHKKIHTWSKTRYYRRKKKEFKIGCDWETNIAETNNYAYEKPIIGIWEDIKSVLTDKEYDLLYRRYYLDQSFREIADSEKVSIEAIRKKIRKILKKVKKYVC